MAFELGTDGIGCVVVGYDGTPPAEGALALAVGIIRRSGGRLLVAIVVTPSVAAASSSVAGAAREARLDEAARLHRQAQQACAREGVVADITEREGDAAREIERVAADVRADVIVVGRSASRTHELIGSVAVRLVKHADRPVLVVP